MPPSIGGSMLNFTCAILVEMVCKGCGNSFLRYSENKIDTMLIATDFCVVFL